MRGVVGLMYTRRYGRLSRNRLVPGAKVIVTQQIAASDSREGLGEPGGGDCG